MTDFSVNDQGSIVLIEPVSQAALDWVEEYIGQDNGFQPYWPTVVVEHRYADDVIEGMLNDGLELG